VSTLRAQSGQAAVELVALLPALALLALLAWQILAAAHGWQLAAGAARAGARSAVVGAPAEAAARATLPEAARPGARVSASVDATGSARVGVAVPVPAVLPGLGPLLVAAGAGAAGSRLARDGPGAVLAPAVPGSGRGAAAARVALGFLGVPYLWGGESPAGFDCSGLVQYVYARLGVSLPRVAEDQARVGAAVPREALQPGDAVFFADASGYVHHEGLYLGGGRFVHAPHAGDVVKVSSLGEPYYAAEFAGARRY
jgi:cell wall-associated NlpC family hydrolase